MTIRFNISLTAGHIVFWRPSFASLISIVTCLAVSISIGGVWAQQDPDQIVNAQQTELTQENQDAAQESALEPDPLPANYDLRQHQRVTSVKAQSGGTCWAHGTMASIESHMLSIGLWSELGYDGEPNLSEYHLDWWNGFNDSHNNDVEDPNAPGMTIHQGGDYRVAAAYIARGDGVVFASSANDDNYRDLLWYEEPPNRNAPDYQKFYIRHIEWYTAGEGVQRINQIKQAIIDHGAIATCYCAGKQYLSDDNIHYQPPSSEQNPNHSVAIVGWDDSKIAAGAKNRAPLPGAWLIKNSWGKERGEEGYYWISYFDKHACQHIELGSVSFRDAEPLRYNRFYSHDYHGWRGTMDSISRVFNAFTAEADDEIQAVSFYTATDNVSWNVKIFNRYEDGLLLDELISDSGTFEVSGFHTVDLTKSIKLVPGEKFFVYLELSAGGQPIDRTSEIPVLLDSDQGPNGPKVISAANPAESYYFQDGRWHDLYDHKFENPDWATFDRTANFCIKAIGQRGEKIAPQK